MPKRLAATHALNAITGAILLALVSTGAEAQEPSSLGADGVISLLIRFGVDDTSPRDWDGSLAVSGGDLVGLRDWRPRPDHQVRGSTWKLASYQGENWRYRVWERPPPAGPSKYFRSPGVIVDVRGQARTRLRIETLNGDFDFRLRDIPAGRSNSFLGGAITVERTAAAELLTSRDYENDYATVLGSSEGEVWSAWIGYLDNATEILARRFDGERWGEVQKISREPGDYFLVKMGRDGKGRPWAVWSAKVDGNWDLYASHLAGSSWSAAERLTRGPQSDIFHNLVSDANGNLWLVWQGFRNGTSDVFVRRYDGASWSKEEKVSSSPANDWEPVVAADSKGAVYVGWDSYGAGNYDVLMRRWADGRWSDEMTVAATPKFEAHLSLAVDNHDRVWAAWNESGVNWGKDTGWSVHHQGTRLYEWRTLGVGVWDGSSWMTPARDVNTALPADLQGYNDFPMLFPDADGRVWLYFRHRFMRVIDVPSDTSGGTRAAWEIWGTTLEGERWTQPVSVPMTGFRQDGRWGLGADGRGNIWASWPMDNRDYENFLLEHHDVYAAKLPRIEGPFIRPTLVTRADEEIPFFAIHLEEEKNLAAMRGYEIESEGKTYRIYRGDTHRHSEFSWDGNNDGSLLQTYRYAIDAAQLEFLLASEHNSAPGPDIEYINWLLQQTADALSISERFQSFYGYERSLGYPDGHRNILFAVRGNPTLPITEAQRTHKEGAASLYEYLKKYDGIAISHSSGSAFMGTDWRDNDPEVEPLVEIYQGDRVSYEYEGAPRTAYRENLRSAPGGYQAEGYVWNAWAKGYKLGVQAASDHLSTHISYACTIAEELTREGLLEAMKKRHSYGATDNIVLDYRLQADGKEYLQGDIVTVSGDFRLSVRVIGTTPIRQIDVIRDQSFVHNRQNLGQDVSFSFVDNEVGPGEHYYYVRVLQNDGNLAWSSPIWVTKR